MIYYLSLPFLLLFLIVFQNSVSDILFFGIVEVEISMILVIYAGFHLDVVRGGILSLVAGFFLDCTSGSVSGLHTFTYISLFLVAMMASTRISLDKTSLIMIFTLICAALKSIMITILYSLIYRVDLSVNILKLYIPQILIVVLISPVFFRIFNWIETLLHGEYAKQFKRT
jgi:cell shape-determining protein MreD